MYRLQTATSDYPGNYDGYDDSWSMKKFKKVTLEIYE